MFSKRSIVAFVLVISVFVSLAYPFQASAQLLSWLGIPSTAEVVQGIAQLIVGFVTIVPAYIFFGVAALTNWMIRIVAEIGVSPGAAGTPQFVSDGYAFSRNFVNIFFLLILVFIGLATILRLREYELQRTLPRLIGMALLVNFSGLLVGFMTDIGNIFTVFFTQSIIGAAGGGLGSTAFSEVFNRASPQIDAIFIGSGGLFAGFGGAMALAGTLVFFYIFATVAYFAIAVVFFMRLVILWTLVILAPFAFLFYILPATRKYWSQWLSALTQWSFITVPLAFFMWLANHVLNSPPIATLSAGPPTTGAVGFWGPVFGAMLSPIVAIVLLFIGLGLSASMSAQFNRARPWLGRATAVGAGVLGGKLLYDKFKQRVANSETLRRMETGQPNSRAGRILSHVPGVAAGARFAGREARGRVRAGSTVNINKAEADAKSQETDVLVSKLKGRESDEKKIGYLNAIIKRGDIDDALDAGLTHQEIARIRRSAQVFDQHRDIDSAMPHSIPEATLKKSYAARELTRIARAANPNARAIQANELKEGQYIGVTAAQVNEERIRMFRRMKADRAKQMSKRAADDPTTSEAMLKGWDGRQVGSFVTEHGREGVDAIQNRLAALASTLPLPVTTDPRVVARVAQGVPVAEAQRRARMQIWLETNANAPLAKYMQSQGGQNLGFSV